MRMTGGHDNRFTFMEQVVDAVDCNFADAVQTGDESVPTRFMGADFLALVEGKQGDADSRVLSQCFADDLSLLIGNLVFQDQNFCLIDIFSSLRS